MRIEDKLALNVFELDKEAHITVDEARCEKCRDKPCLRCCPAVLYRLEDGRIFFNYEGCLECGTCLIICHNYGNGGVNWNYPRGGFGIYYRYG